MNKLVNLVVALLLLALADPAEAFRCKSRVVRDGMHEAEVLRLCGEPVSVRDLGYVVRSFGYGNKRGLGRQRVRGGAYGYYQREVRVTEMVFNFGPRRFMRRVVFEGGIVASISTLSYGYTE